MDEPLTIAIDPPVGIYLAETWTVCGFKYQCVVYICISSLLAFNLPELQVMSC